MPKLYCTLGLIALACLPTALLRGAETAEKPAEKPQTTPEQEKQIKLLLVTLRSPRSDAERRLRAVREMLATGPAGAAALQDYLDKELQRVGGQIKDPPSTAAYDDKIAQFRKTLAELRNDPNLSKEKTQEVGLPALNELTRIWQQRDMFLKGHYQKYAKVATQASRLVEFLQRWEVKAKQDKWLQADGLSLGEYREKAEKLLASTLPPQDEKIRRVLEENEKIMQGLPQDIIAGLRALNAMRIMCGVQPLVVDLKLCEAARLHSGDMLSRGFFSHESPVPGKKTFSDRARLAGTTASGENIYMGGNMTVDAIKAWFLSPGHHKNMLGDSRRRQGLGRAGNHWTQMFGQ